MMMTSKGIAFSRAAEAELSARRLRSERETKARRSKVRGEYPAIKSILDEITDIGIEFADKMIASPRDADALQTLASGLIEKKKTELAEALVSNGLPADYLEPVYVCPVCRDTGKDGFEICACIKQLAIENMFSGSGLNGGETFETFRHDLISDPRESKALERIYAYCLSYADRFPENELPDILLMGAPGVGKTFLLNCIGARVLNNGHSVLKITANRLVNSVLDSIRDRETERPDFISPELLMIDDLGAEPMIANVTLETLLSIICERQDQRRATLIATNKTIEDLADEYGERIVSRIISPRNVKVIRMTTPSIRIMKF